jgi:hypothetical protein
MPRKNSTNWSAGDDIAATRLQNFNQDIDDLYQYGNDRGRVQKAASATALKIDISAFTFVVGTVTGQYAGATDISVTNSATNYVEIDNSGTIQINTSGWTVSPSALCRLATVTCAGGVVTAISIWKSDAVSINTVAQTIFGSGSDGAVTWSADTNLNPANQFNYSSATLNATKILSVSSVNAPLIIGTSGNVTLNGTLNLSGKGGAGGAQQAGVGSNTVGLAGNNGAAGDSLVSSFVNVAAVGGGGGQKINGGSAGGGGGGGSGSDVLTGGAPGIVGGNGIGGGTSAGGTAGPAGTVIPSTQLAILTNLLRGVACGGGGASGGSGGNGGASGTSGTGGAGGNGGGAAVWFVGGNLTLGASSVINVSGTAGSNGGSVGSPVNVGGGGGGGGGAGGMVIIVVAGSITNSGVTLTVTGGGAGAGGTGSTNGGTGGNGGAAPNGHIFIYSLSTGTIITA